MPAKGRPQLPCLARREVEVEARAAVRADGLRHAEEVRARPGTRTLLRAAGPRARLAGRSDERSAAAKSGCAAIRAAWSGQPRNRVARSRSRNRIVRAGSGVGLRQQGRSREEHREQPAAEAAHPEERHRDVQPLSGADAPRLEPGRGGPERAPVRVDHALRRAAASRREQDRPCRRRDAPTSSSASTMLGARGRVGQLARRPDVAGAPAARDRAAPLRIRSTSAGASDAQVVEVRAARGRRAP